MWWWRRVHSVHSWLLWNTWKPGECLWFNNEIQRWNMVHLAWRCEFRLLYAFLPCSLAHQRTPITPYETCDVDYTLRCDNGHVFNRYKLHLQGRNLQASFSDDVLLTELPGSVYFPCHSRPGLVRLRFLYCLQSDFLVQRSIVLGLDSRPTWSIQICRSKTEEIRHHHLWPVDHLCCHPKTVTSKHEVQRIPHSVRHLYLDSNRRFHRFCDHFGCLRSLQATLTWNE